MNNPIITRFCKLVGKKRRCFPTTKHVLFQRLEEELHDLPDEVTTLPTALETRMGEASSDCKRITVYHITATGMLRYTREAILLIGEYLGLHSSFFSALLFILERTI